MNTIKFRCEVDILLTLSTLIDKTQQVKIFSVEIQNQKPVSIGDLRPTIGQVPKGDQRFREQLGEVMHTCFDQTQPVIYITDILHKPCEKG